MYWGLTWWWSLKWVNWWRKSYVWKRMTWMSNRSRMVGENGRRMGRDVCLWMMGERWTNWRRVIT